MRPRITTPPVRWAIATDGTAPKAHAFRPSDDPRLWSLVCRTFQPDAVVRWADDEQRCKVCERIVHRETVGAAVGRGQARARRLLLTVRRELDGLADRYRERPDLHAVARSAFVNELRADHGDDEVRRLLADDELLAAVLGAWAAEVPST